MNKKRLYLLPGLMTDERLWSRLKPHLEDEFELIHISLPLTISFDESVEKINELIKEDNINLLGFSLGGYCASYFTIKYPNRVKKLLVAGTPSSMNQDEIEKREQTLKQMDTLGFKGLSYKKTKSLLEESNQNDEKLIELIQDMYSSLGKDVFKTQMKSTLKRKDVYDEFLKLNIPIRVFYSTQDRLLNHESLEKITDKHTNIEKISREGLSHMIPLEMPEKLAHLIREWI